MPKLVPNHAIDFQPGPDRTPAELRERAQRALLYADTLFYPDTFGRNAAAERLRNYAAELEARAAALSLFSDVGREDNSTDVGLTVRPIPVYPFV